MEAENKVKERLADLDKLREKDCGDVELLRRKIGELKAELRAKNEELRKVKLNAAVDAALTAAGAKNIVAVKALIPGLDEMELLEDGTIKGLSEKINAVKKSDDYLFEQRSSKFTIRGAKPGESGYDGIDNMADISKMTYSQLAEYIKKNPTAKVFD